jgi:hypothetical protein
MRAILTIWLLAGIVLGQATQTPAPEPAPTPNPAPQAGTNSMPAGQPAAAQDPHAVVIPAGTKVPLSLKQAISTKNAHEGDAVYAETVFPFVANDRMLIPAGTYIQGKISHVEHSKRGLNGRAALLIHFTSMIYPSGYTVMLPGSIQNTPGAEDKGVKDNEGTIQADKDTGKRVEDAAKGGAVGGTVGSIGGLAAGGLNGARYGGLAGLAGGVAWALLKHGPDVKLEVGTSLEMEIQRDVPVDATRIHGARAGS